MLTTSLVCQTTIIYRQPLLLSILDPMQQRRRRPNLRIRGSRRGWRCSNPLKALLSLSWDLMQPLTLDIISWDSLGPQPLPLWHQQLQQMLMPLPNLDPRRWLQSAVVSYKRFPLTSGSRMCRWACVLTYGDLHSNDANFKSSYQWYISISKPHICMGLLGALCKWDLSPVNGFLFSIFMLSCPYVKTGFPQGQCRRCDECRGNSNQHWCGQLVLG